MPARHIKQYYGTVRNHAATSDEPVSPATLEKLTAQIAELERALRVKDSELAAAEEHIAAIEAKVFKLKEAAEELKRLRHERQRLRRSPERRIGQVLLAPYRLPQKLLRALMPFNHRSDGVPAAAETLQYQEWFERHRAKSAELGAMRKEARKFTARPLFSVVMPVFNTPVSWLQQAVQSVTSQAYDNWELFVIDDASTDARLAKYLAELAGDSRIRVLRLEKNAGISGALNHGLEQTRGDWIAFLDHDDLLEPDALFHYAKLVQMHADADLIYSDEDKLTESGLARPEFKPAWSPDLLRSRNYISHFLAVRRGLIQRVSGFRPEFDGAQDYDLLLRVSEYTDRIHHVPRVLYHWRRTRNSSAADVRQKPGQLEAARRAVEEHCSRQGASARVAMDWPTHTFRVHRALRDPKKVSIIILAGDDRDRLSRCIETACSITRYPDYDILLVDPKPQPERVGFSSSKVRRVMYPWPVNAGAMNNFAAKQTDGAWLLFLRPTVEIIEADWLTAMAEHAQRPETGAVGALLLKPDGTVQHAGLVIGVGPAVDEACRGFPAEASAPGKREWRLPRNCSAVSSACLLTRRDVFDRCGGFDEDLRLVTSTDVDLCLRLRRAGYLIVYTPAAKLYCNDGPRADDLEATELAALRERWGDLVDPYYNPNLSRERADFSLGN